MHTHHVQRLNMRDPGVEQPGMAGGVGHPAQRRHSRTAVGAALLLPQLVAGLQCLYGDV
jgi:hypothetical protein